MLQVRQCLAQREAVDTEPCSELTLRRESITWVEVAGADRTFYDFADLGMKRALGTREITQPRRGVAFARPALVPRNSVAPHAAPPLAPGDCVRRIDAAQWRHGIEVFAATDLLVAIRSEE